MKNLKVILIGIISISTTLILVVMCAQSIQNRAYLLEEQVNIAASDIKVQEKRRVDLIYNLVDCVKQYDTHELQTLTAIIEGRGSNGDIESASIVIKSVAEDYPQLQSNENYKNLMNELSLTENIIAQHRSNFNLQVKSYNRYTRKFPNSVILNSLGYDYQYFKYLDFDTPVDAPKDLFKR